mgnify:CR=1 FL=1
MATVGKAYRHSHRMAGILEIQPKQNAVTVVMVVRLILFPISCMVCSMRSTGCREGDVLKYAPVIMNVSSVEEGEKGQ